MKKKFTELVVFQDLVVATVPLWTDPGLKSEMSVHELISTSKKRKKKKPQAGIEWLNILPKSLQVRKKQGGGGF